MKKALLSMVAILFAIYVFAQTKSELDEKGRKQIKTGFIIMGVGAVMAIGGLVLGDPEAESSTQAIVVLTGAGLVVTGILVAVFGANKKERAYRMVGKIETMPQFRNGDFVKKAFPSIGLQITLGR